MGPRALTASSGLAPWSMAVDLGSLEGSPSQFPHQLKKSEGISA